jgi:class 3 adenylate cyclase/DNA-binding SARP family transcriptional activator
VIVTRQAEEPLKRWAGVQTSPGACDSVLCYFPLPIAQGDAVEFRILGPLEVADGTGRTLALGGAKQRALLAILLINANQVVAAERLVDDLWGEEVPMTASNALQVYVSQLRKIIRPEVGGGNRSQIVTRSPGYVLEIADLDLDLARFAELTARGREALTSDEIPKASVLLRSALALWRGAPLADFTYEPFAQISIEKLEEMRILAFEYRIEADLAMGRQAEVIPELEAAIALDPLRERLREHLMLALYRSSRQAEALKVYQDTMGVLADQLGIDPSPPLQRLHEAILRQESSLELVPQEAAPLRTPEPAVPEPILVPESSMQEMNSVGGQVLPVTVLFADIVGSTALGERLSSDEVRAVIGECVSRMSHVVEEFGGTVQAYMGDGICVYFGLPRSHEDDPERAAHAALGIRRLVDDFAREVESAWGIEGFAVRIGINSGQTVVGLVGAGAPQEVTFGDISNVAARLESSAKPGSIYLGRSVADRLTRGFALKPQGTLKVKGRKGAVEAWELIDLVALGDIPSPTPLIGRDRELERGHGVMSALEAGRGQVLLLRGDTGVGKSRLLSELRHLPEGNTAWLTGRCRSFGAEHSAKPFVQVLRDWLGVIDEEPPMVVRMKLRSRLGEILPEASEVFPLLARFLSVDEEPTTITPQSELETGVFDAYATWISAIAEVGPIVVAIEDVHEADRSTRTLAQVLLPVTDRAPLLLAFTARPTNGTEGWKLLQGILADYRHRTTDIQLEPLSDESTGAFLDTIAPTGNLDDAMKIDLIARAAGNPLFAEELLRLLIESGGLERQQGWTLTASSSVLVLPPALEGLLVSRIQHLPPPVLSLVQTASVIGQNVSAPILEEVAGAIDMHVGIDILLRAEILQELRRYPELEYTFKHPMMQEAALSTLTPARARELYGKVGAALESRLKDPDDAHLERLAYCYYRSDDRKKALEYLEQAAQRAIQRDQIERGTELLERAKKAAIAIGDKDAGRRLDALL